MSENTPVLEIVTQEKPTVQPPAISITEDEAALILDELGLVELSTSPPADQKPKKVLGFDVRKAIRLGLFIEENAVRVDNGKVFVADQILLTHLMRLNEKAKEMSTTKELAEIAYPIGYVASQIKKSAKTKIVVEAVQGGAGRPSQPSWTPGEKVLPAQTAA